MQISIKGISSMATRQLLIELVASYQEIVLCDIAIESVGGLDAVKRIMAGEAFDVVFFASETIDKLITTGHVAAASKLDLVNSGVALAVKAGEQLPNISSEASLKVAVLAAKTIGYSTGPSGLAVAKLFEQWGISEQIASRIVVAAPGVPVGLLIAKGEVELGFQQLSEFIHENGISIVGPLPPEIQITTTFSAGICTGSKQADAVRDLLAFMALPATADIKLRHGTEIIT